MDRLAKLLIAAIAFAVVQTVNAVAFPQKTFAWITAAFCWAVAAAVWRRKTIR